MVLWFLDLSPIDRVDEMDTKIFEDVQEKLRDAGPEGAIHALCAHLREKKEFSKLFYALLLKKRFELGVSPVPTGPVDALPPESHEPYEDGIREAARLVGDLL